MLKSSSKKWPSFTWSEVRGILLFLLGVVSLAYFYSWWFTDGRLTSPVLAIAFVIALVIGSVQLLGNWTLYLATHHRRHVVPDLAQPLRVDVFVTTYGEEPALVERSLLASVQMRGEKRVWLLDDGRDPVLEAMAEQLGVGYLTRNERTDAKAGNINAALTQTDGDIVVIFDVDHAPHPAFLERTLPHFNDPQVGFVQVMLTFENSHDGWVAHAASESSLDFYNPTSVGADGLKGATLVGSNALVRREALLSIKGYRPGLAEDLATSVALHAAGWQSVYVQEPLAPGFAPPDLASWLTQQLKWARGVFELLLTVYPRLFGSLQIGQRVSYGVRMTYYWIGLVVALHLLASIVVLLFGNASSLEAYTDYLLHLLPLGLITMVIRELAWRRWRHPDLPRGSFQIKPVALVAGSWPAYTLAWIMAVLRVRLPFRATPKRPTGDFHLFWLLPQLTAALLLSLGLLRAFSTVNSPLNYWLPLGFASGQMASQLILLGIGLSEMSWAGLAGTGRMRAERQARLRQEEQRA